ncbi:TDT family transporter [Isachenkonia alkalipeptolytica]|uniref:TDT family transporter n=1 Tax=Isachenkonia alkalipeptolytica TaxID=2565777 RepID=A0AA44BDT0_9CLOT|nr:TDT family transporter [Isachenkonia alkalipeptolytica]
MKRFLKTLPLPISGLMLGLAALGNLLGPYAGGLRYFLGSISALIFLSLIVKVLLFPKSLREGFDNPVVGSIFPTFTMGGMLLSTYINPYFPAGAFGLWVLSLVLNALIIVLFTKKYVLNFSIKKVFSSYFVMYVGIVVASVTAPLYGLEALGQAVFWFGLFAYLLWLPIVIYRVFWVKEIPEAAKPIAIIFAAPASLLLAGYLSSFPEKSMGMVVFLGSLGLLMTVFALSQMPKMLRLPFYPSYSAFTFPFVISAIAFNGMTGYFSVQGIENGALDFIRGFQIAWAAAMVLYVLVRFGMLFQKQAALQKEAA